MGAGQTSKDGEVYPCRNNSGAVGKLNLEDGKACNFWFHGDWFAKGSGEVLTVGPVPEGSDAPPAPAPPAPAPPAPTPTPESDPSPAVEPVPVDPAHYNQDVLCDGAKASDRVQWLITNQSMAQDQAVKVVME